MTGSVPPTTSPRLGDDQKPRARRPRPAGTRRRPPDPSPRRLPRIRFSPVALAALALGVMTSAGAMLALGSSSGDRHSSTPQVTGGCVQCMSEPAPSAGGGPSRSATPQSSASPRAARPSPAATRSGRPATGPATTALPPGRVSVSYVPGSGGGAYTITNKSSAPLPSWRLSFSYPRGHLVSLGPAQLSRDGKKYVVTGGSIAGGQSVTIRLSAKGPSGTPTGCLLNGIAC